MKLKVLRNREVKSIIFKVLAIEALLITVILVLFNMNNKKLIDKIVDNKANIVASILESHPEIENDIIKSILNEVRPENIEKGRDILKSYGYSEDMDILLEPIVNNYNKNNLLIFLGILVVMALLTILIIYFEMKRVYKKVNTAYTYVNNVLEDKNETLLDYEGEGEFPILANEINKMVSVIKNDNEIIHKEKEYLKEILTDISHQLKTPLTSITMLADILIQKENMPKERKLEFLEKILNQSEKMEWLIYNLLKLARLDAGTINFSKEKVNIDEVIKSSISLLETKILEKNILINIEGDTAYFIGDKEWTVEAVTNIIKNAIEHSKENSKIYIIKESSNVYTRLIVKDYGEGIDNKDLPNIFKRFYTSNKSPNSNSIGVGLAMAKSIIEKENGYIVVRSEKDKGSEFEITFIL